MAIYMLNLVVVSVCGYLAERTKKFNNDAREYKYKFIFIIVATLSLILVSGFRYKVGTDFTTYSEYIIYSNGDSVSIFNEGGFYLLLNILRNITKNPQLFFMVTSIFINIGVVIFLVNNSDNIFLSIYFYITTFMYYLTMNGVRQYIATIILMLGYKHLINGNFKKYFLYIFGAFLFHSSVLIMIPVYFIVRKKFDSVWNVALFLFTLMAIIFYKEFIEILFVFLGHGRFAYYKKILLNDVNGANPIRIIVWLAPVILTFMYKERAKKVYGDKIDVVLNLCYVGSIFMVLATKQVFFARVCMFFDGYYLLLLPKLCNLFDKKNNRILTIIIMLGYFGYSLLLLRRGEAWIAPYNYNLQIF